MVTLQNETSIIPTDPTANGSVQIVSDILPADLMPWEEVVEREKDASKLLSTVVNAMYPGRNFVIRSLLPGDIGIGEWNETASTTDDDWETSQIAGTSGTHQLSSERVACIYGLLEKSPVPIAQAYRITAGNQLNLQVSLERIQGTKSLTGYFRSPKILTDGIAVKVEHFLRQIAGYTGANGTLDVQWIALIAEPSGRNISA